jgi:hypothetical protein
VPARRPIGNNSGSRKFPLTPNRSRSADTHPADLGDTILREAEQHEGAKIRRSGVGHRDVAFYVRAEIRKYTSDELILIDADYEKSAHLAALVVQYRTAAGGRNRDTANSWRPTDRDRKFNP